MSVYFNGKKVSIASTTKVYGGKYNVIAEDKEDGTQKLIINTTPTNPAIVPTGTIDITENGQVDVTKYAFANVNVSSGDNKFSQLVDKSITTVTADDLDGIASIGDNAFSRCYNLTEITVPNSVTRIGTEAFHSCRNLTTVYFTENSKLQTISDFAFYACYKLVSINIPEGVTSIGYQSFYDCSTLSEIILPSTLNSIGNYAFTSCYALTTITIPESVTSIRNSAFSNCSSLQTVIYKGQVPDIQNGCFQSCSSIARYDFRNCTAVPTLAKVSSLGHATGCQIIIPDSLYDEWITATNWSSLDVTYVKASEYVE